MESRHCMVNEFLPEGNSLYIHKDVNIRAWKSMPTVRAVAKDATARCTGGWRFCFCQRNLCRCYSGQRPGNYRWTPFFGQGLVQQPIDFSDGSAIRLTIARYYTHPDVASNAPTKAGKTLNTKWTGWPATNMESSSLKTASNSTKTCATPPDWDVPFMAVAASCRCIRTPRHNRVSSYLIGWATGVDHTVQFQYTTVTVKLRCSKWTDGLKYLRHAKVL